MQKTQAELNRCADDKMAKESILSYIAQYNVPSIFITGVYLSK